MKQPNSLYGSRSLTRDFSLGFLIIILLISILVFSTSGLIFLKIEGDKFNKEAHSMFQELKNLIVTPLWHYDDAEIASICQTFLSGGKVSKIVIYSNENRQLYAFGEIKQNESDRELFSDNLIYNTKLIGKLEFFPKKPEYFEQNKFYFFTNILAISTICIFITIATWWLLGTYVKRPLGELLDWIDNVERGDYETAEVDCPQREIQSVVRHFSLMVDSIKNREQQIRESENRYRTLFESANDAIFIMKDDTFVDCNQKTLEMFSCTKEQIIGNQPHEFSPPTQPDGNASKEKAKEKIKAAFEGEPQFFEWKHTRSDATLFDAEVSLNLVELSTGMHIQAIVRDITERKQAEEALEKSEANFRALVEFSPAAISILKGEQLIYVNPAWQQMTGYSEEETQRLDPFLIVHPEMREETKQRALARYRGEQVPSRYEFKGITKDGEVKWSDFSAVVIEYDNEPAILTVGVDITDRKLAEEALQETEKKLEAIINHHFQLTGMLDPQGRLIMANKTALDYLKAVESDVLGKLFWETPWWSHSKEEQEKLQNAIQIAGKGEFVRFETSHLNSNRELRIIDFSINPVIGDQGNVKYLIPEGRDITELKEAEKSLRESASQLRSLATRLQEIEEIARKALARELHDQVGQSLTALSINLNILRNQLPPDALKQLEERLDDSMELVEETTKTIRDVMAELRPSVLDDYGLTAALRWYGKRFSDRTGISIKLKMDEMSSRLTETVESALFRIVQEALTNVAKHANASELVLTSEESEDLFRLIIADNGRGFDYAALSRVEVRTGWGILNMKERIQVLGGQLQIDSELGKGTSVIIKIRK